MDEQYSPQQYSQESPQRIRDLEEKQRLLKDRLLLVGQGFVEEKEKTSNEIREIKKTLLKLQEENTRMKEIIERLAEQANNSARKEELMIIQRQLDLFRKR